MTEEERETGQVSRRIYWLYLGALGSMVLIGVVTAAFVLDTVAKVSSDYSLSIWSEAADASERVGFYAGIYASLSLVSVVVTYGRTVLVFFRGLRASQTLHDRMLERILRAPLSFFETTPVGRVLNRFSRSFDQIDQQLPDYFSTMVGMGLWALATVVVIAAVTPLFLALFVPVTYFYVQAQRRYLASSRELERLSSISVSPVLAQFSETLNGLSTIRAFERTEQVVSVLATKINTSTSARYTANACKRWLSIRLETVGQCIVGLAALLSVLQHSIGAGLAGLSISYAMEATGVLNWVARIASTVETMLVHVERVQHYSELPMEAAVDTDAEQRSHMPKSWPTRGTISFRHVQIRYRDNLPLVCRDLTLQIDGGQKIGICGRTGAGKSSTVLALFRFQELAGGAIEIDGVDIARIGLHELRSHLSYIPQHDVLFAGTIRSNLDPFHEYSDLEVWDALRGCSMDDYVRRLEQQLLHAVAEGGENLSQGQRQLLCLGRALLKRRQSKVLVIDEATASVDFDTDALIQRTIRTEFRDCTVLTIAHRINTILDYDKILVLDNGEVAEFDTPQRLLQSGGLFAQLAAQSKTNSDKLVSF
jgi:ABC-type multidrug transport system fused ATPase/permease subunit